MRLSSKSFFWGVVKRGGTIQFCAVQHGGRMVDGSGMPDRGGRRELDVESGMPGCGMPGCGMPGCGVGES